MSKETNQICHVAAAEDNTVLGCRWAAITQGQYANALSEGGRQDDPILLLSPTPNLWVAPGAGPNPLVFCGSDQFIDARFMKRGAPSPLIVQTNRGASASIVTEGGNHLIGPNALVAIYRGANGDYRFNPLGAADGEGVTRYGGAEAPACDFSIITAGQSLARRLTAGAGTGGFQKGWRDYTGRTSDSFWWLEGAIGGSGLVPAAHSTSYWWDPATNTPGPNALAWKAALDAKPSGQPAPSLIIWIFGQTDAGKIGTDPTMTLDAYKSTLKTCLEWLQDQINPETRTPVMICPVGAWDNPYDKVVQSVRWVEMDLIAENDSFHLGPAYFDLPRPWEDVHHHTNGQALLGYRIAAVMDNILHGAGHATGPKVTGIQALDGGTHYRLTIAAHPQQQFTRPLAPEGFVIYAAGANPLVDAPIPTKSAVWAQISETVWSLTFDLGAAFPDATLMFPYGACTWSRGGRWPMNLRNDPPLKGYGNVWPLVPFKAGVF